MLTENKDRNDIERFIPAQEEYYSDALEEIRCGRKMTHWIWFIFPQLRGLGHSRYAVYYGIADIEEAKRYLAHPVLGSRLAEITNELLKLEENDPVRIMGGIDSVKLCSCMTLFAEISEEGSPFHKVLDRFYSGKRDELTLKLINSA